MKIDINQNKAFLNSFKIQLTTVNKLLVLGLLLVSSHVLLAQDDELPPPSSKPKTLQQYPFDKNDQGLIRAHRRVDLSKYIIEPDVNFSVVPGGYEVGVAPTVGYNVWKGLFVGGGLTYIYTGYKNITITDNLGGGHSANAKSHTYGGGVFLQYNVWRGLFVRTRFDILHRSLDDVEHATALLNTQNNAYEVKIPHVQKTIPGLLVGIGYNLLENRNFFFPITISYNVLSSVTDKQYSPYSRGLVFQLGFINIF